MTAHRIISLAVALVATTLSPAFAGDWDDPGVEHRKRILERRIFQYFTLGTTAPIDWFKETRDTNGCRWDFRQAYFSGGAQTGWDAVFWKPWNKWVNPKKVRGVFGERFIKDCVENGFIPWVTMYNLAQSKPAEYKPGPAKATPVNARNAGTMKAYWEQVKLIMQICDKYKPFPVVLHVEPDEWGHMLLGAPNRRGKRLEALDVDVKVGASGMPDVAGLEDNLRGYSHAWLKLRAMYAPYNVILITNPSAWDQNGSMSASNWIRIFKEADVTKWDAAVLETGDRDIGCVPGKGKGPPYEEVATTGSHFNNLNEQLRWIEAFYKGTGLPVYFWQVGVGNFYFRSCNQTKGHFCDTIAQGLLEGYPKNTMIARYVSIGCYGFVFSPGQGHQTHVHDAMKDGITNPEPISGSLGHVAKYPDDDGGYMRLRGGKYYKQPFPILAKATVKKTRESRPLTFRPKPKKRRTPTTEGVEAWDNKLRSRITEEIAAGRSIKFFLVSLRKNAAILAVNDDGSLKVKAGPVTMDAAWARFSFTERTSMTLSVLRDENPEDHLMAAFYNIAAGHDDDARVHLNAAGEYAGMIDMYFEQDETEEEQ